MIRNYFADDQIAESYLPNIRSVQTEVSKIENWPLNVSPRVKALDWMKKVVFSGKRKSITRLPFTMKRRVIPPLIL